jgi:lipoate-protein ligase B
MRSALAPTTCQGNKGLRLKHTQIHSDAGLAIEDLGLRDYAETLDLQQKLWRQRRDGDIPDTVLIVEHPAVITLGARQSANRLLEDAASLAARGINIVSIRRGGGATAHNPGQVVFYPIIELAPLRLGVNEYVRELENIGIELLAAIGVAATRKPGFPGLWVLPRKIASIGVRISKGVTYHGMAININNDLALFSAMVPCGLDGVTMTSALETTGKQHDMALVKAKLADILARHFAGKVR